MTDQEAALRLGNYIVDLIREIEAIKGAVLEYRIQAPDGRKVEIPLAEVKKMVSLEEGFLQVSDAQRSGLLQAIGNETQASALIRALCKHFLME